MKCAVRELSPDKDEFGPEHIYEVFDVSNDNTVGWVVIDNTARSPSGIGKGGTAMYPGCDLSITLTKARVMTWKQVFCVPVGKSPKYEPWGGAKGGICYDSTSPNAKQVLQAWARALYEAKIIPYKYICGLDVGMKEWASQAIVEELHEIKAATGKPESLGGIPYDKLGLTGYGCLLGMDVMARAKGIDLSNPETKIGIQGLGAVGYGFAKWLEKLYPGGAKIVMASRRLGALHCERGLHADQYQELFSKLASGKKMPKGVSKIKLGRELYLPVDCLLLAHKENQITTKNVRHIKSPIIVEGANRGVSDDAEKILWQNGALSLTDFIVNNGASCAVYVEYAGGSIDDAVNYIEEVVKTNALYILEELKKSTKSPRQLAEEIAKNAVRKAMSS